MVAACTQAIWTTIAHSVSPLGCSLSIMASAALTAMRHADRAPINPEKQTILDPRLDFSKLRERKS